jgi:L-alanine-DL-glutamate epimerase-like enolase superfamily enzyme
LWVTSRTGEERPLQSWFFIRKQSVFELEEGFPLIITDVTTIRLRFPMSIAMADAIHYMPDRPTLLVQVHTDEGIVGLGEAAAYGGFLESTEAIITGELRRTIVGEDPFRVEKLWQMMATRAHQRGRRGMLSVALAVSK